jgi:hypothetical protein
MENADYQRYRTGRDRKTESAFSRNGDIHCTRTSQGTLQPLFEQIADSADVLLLCGDLTDYGLPEEAHILTQELSTARFLCLRY